MKAAVLERVGTVRYGEFEDPRSAGRHDAVLDVLAAGINHLDIAKASGTFYLGAPTCPSVVGTDGVGMTSDGRRVYFDECVAPYGSLAERALVDPVHLLPVHPDLPAATAATLGNAGIAAAIALLRRGRLEAGERVLVVGATGTVGHLTVQLAALSGAGLVVAAGRDVDRLHRLDRYGAVPAMVVGTRRDMGQALSAVSPDGFDVVVDIVGGEPGNAALRSTSFGARYVQVGSKAGGDLEIPTTRLRSRLLTLTGTAGVLEGRADRARAYAHVQRLASDGLLDVGYEEFALEQIELMWRRQIEGPSAKLVMTTSGGTGTHVS